MSKENFIEMLLPFAREAEAVCGVDPVVLLAQAALESDWGNSLLAKSYHNYFHSCGYGRPNRFWEGARSRCMVVNCSSGVTLIHGTVLWIMRTGS